MTVAHAPLHEDLAAVASAVSVAPGPDPVTTLAGLIYRDHYVRPQGRAPVTVLDAAADRDFQESLIRAARPRATWEPGWRRAGADGDRVTVVSPHGVRFWVRPERVRNASCDRETRRPVALRPGANRPFDAFQAPDE